jgi:hypothetical protein
MKNAKLITTLTLALALLAGAAAALGIFSAGGPGPRTFTTVHGEAVVLYGKGVYSNMSAEVAPQGIAQDVVTLFAGIPLLLLGLLKARKGSTSALLLLTGTLGYFFVTYLFYLMMAVFSVLFPLHCLSLSLAFFSLVLSARELRGREEMRRWSAAFPARAIGSFLIFSALMIALLWLSVVIPPLMAHMVPVEVAHYTTLVVQGLDLALLLPICFVSGVLLLRRCEEGFLYASVYCVFLALLMTALTAKVLAMAVLGFNVMPAVLIIPVFNLLSILAALTWFKNLRSKRS